MYRSYLAGEKEPRIQWTSLYDTRSRRKISETALGGRAGLLRYGTYGSVNPQGFQWDVEGAAFARVLPDEPSTMLEAADFRVGTIATWRHQRMAVKAGYYHISSHLGDEFLLANLLYPRINYVRDSLIAGVTYDLTQAWQVYGEIGNALGYEGGALPLELQFGTQYTPIPQNSLHGRRSPPSMLICGRNLTWAAASILFRAGAGRALSPDTDCESGCSITTARPFSTRC